METGGIPTPLIKYDIPMTGKILKAAGVQLILRFRNHSLLMHLENPIALSNFYVTGINYKKSEASVRGEFSISAEQYEQLIASAFAFDITSFFVLSTCNRTEIYGFATDAKNLTCLLTSQTTGTLKDFSTLSYTKTGVQAIQHLFNVAAGLDSQILGDYEIVGQVRQAVKTAKKNNCLHPLMERMVNEVLQSSKKIRTATGLSGGTVSVSFAAVQFIRRHWPDKSKNKILIAGTGKFGSNLCKNIADYLPEYKITLVNRTPEKAGALALEFNCAYTHFEDLETAVQDADIILVATHAEEPIILQQYFIGKPQLVIDLSIPCNVEAAVSDLPFITVADVDKLSRIKDETLYQRKLEVPKAMAIIAEHLQAFIEWYAHRQHAPVLKAVKIKLLTIHQDPLILPGGKEDASCLKEAEYRIQKVINGMAVKMKTKNQKGCNYIEAINDFIAPAPN
ncbi:MAG: glutamyl-tRNA reductase [Ferruginibacter sp.]